MNKQITSVKTDLIFFVISSIFLSLWIAIIGYNYPFYNWDLLPYVASALSYEIDNITELHKTTYEIVSISIPKELAASLDSGTYLKHMFNNPVDFYSQLNFYKVKPLYIFLILFFYKLGVPIVGATLLISTISVILASIIVYYWIARYINIYLAFGITVLIILESRLADLARVSTPDAFSALIIIISLYLLIEKKALKVAMALLVSSILIRSNNIIFVSMFTLYYIYIDFITKKKLKLCYAHIILIISLLIYLLINILVQPYGWWVLFYHSFVEEINNPNVFSLPFNLNLYLDVLQSSAKSLFVGGLSLASVLFCFMLISFFALNNMNKYIRDYKFLIYIIYINFILYFLLFPGVEHWDRFFTPFYIIVTVIAIINSTNKRSLS
jgi:hypothetical protein